MAYSYSQRPSWSRTQEKGRLDSPVDEQTSLTLKSTPIFFYFASVFYLFVFNFVNIFFTHTHTSFIQSQFFFYVFLYFPFAVRFIFLLMTKGGVVEVFD